MVGSGDFRLCTQQSTVNSSAPQPWVVNGAYSLMTNKFNEAVYLSHKVSAPAASPLLTAELII